MTSEETVPRAEAPGDAHPLAAPDPIETDAALEALRAGEVADGPLDFTAARLIGEDLSGLDLSGANFSGAELSRANFSGATLLGANFAGATLFEADLSRAELSGADLSGANLEGADLTRAGLGMANLTAASLMRADLSRATLTQTTLSGANAELADLTGCRAREADLTGASFTKACLREVEMDGSRIHGTTFDGADLRAASLQSLRGFQRASWIGVDIRDIDFTGAYLCRRFVHDQNFLQEFQSQGRWSRFVFELWRITSDCGRSLTRWAFCTLVLVFAFAFLYAFTAVDYGDYETAVSPYYFSVVTMTTLGFGDVLPADVPAQVVVMFQVVTGYVMLGGLLSIFSNKMARRAD